LPTISCARRPRYPTNQRCSSPTLHRRLPKVHPLNVGLWGRTANITQTGFHGNWGRVFKEAEPGQSGMPAYSVQVRQQLRQGGCWWGCLVHAGVASGVGSGSNGTSRQAAQIMPARWP